MAIQNISIDITLTRDQMIHLLLLGGLTEVARTTPTLKLFGCFQHVKAGKPGVEDGSIHIIDCYAQHGHQYGQVAVKVRSSDNGSTYVGVAELRIETDSISD